MRRLFYVKGDVFCKENIFLKIYTGGPKSLIEAILRGDEIKINS